MNADACIAFRHCCVQYFLFPFFGLQPNYSLSFVNGGMYGGAAKQTLMKSQARRMVARKVGPKQVSHGHLKSTTNSKSYVNSMADAQNIVDATKQGQARIMKITADGKVYIEYLGVTGQYVRNNGTLSTNKFYIIGLNNTKVVPVHPSTK